VKKEGDIQIRHEDAFEKKKRMRRDCHAPRRKKWTIGEKGSLVKGINERKASDKSWAGEGKNRNLLGSARNARYSYM